MIKGHVPGGPQGHDSRGVAVVAPGILPLVDVDRHAIEKTACASRRPAP
ncbi:MAG TPA: hypothetical protein VFL12_03820 [Thermoanaerobaculia bacterium]|nr:hypothetical protein [Thermoanaerobaculia bacterium]